ncbi:hypothetical protein MBP16_005840, partial [Klebsiella pneumoniae]|nr:hypothetical protein [Klebsiella pneumoniae]
SALINKYDLRIATVPLGQVKRVQAGKHFGALPVHAGNRAYAMMGGIVVGTALTILFLRALYVAWFWIPREVEQTD